MRVYVPVTAADLVADEISPRRVHGVTAAEQREFPGEDLESLELVATLYAADDSMDRIAAARAAGEPLAVGESLALRRLVAVGIAPNDWIAPIFGSSSGNSSGDGDGGAALDGSQKHGEVPVTAIMLLHALGWEKIESIYVDEPGSEALIARAMAGDEAAFEAAADIDLLWYDVTERAELAAELGVAVN